MKTWNHPMLLLMLLNQQEMYLIPSQTSMMDFLWKSLTVESWKLLLQKGSIIYCLTGPQVHLWDKPTTYTLINNCIWYRQWKNPFCDKYLQDSFKYGSQNRNAGSENRSSSVILSKHPVWKQGWRNWVIKLSWLHF